MILRRILPIKSLYYKTSVFSEVHRCLLRSNLSSFHCSVRTNRLCSLSCYINPSLPQTCPIQSYLLAKRLYSKGLLDGDITEFQNQNKNNELQSLNKIFPDPRVTLKQLADKMQEKVFDVHYKQTVVAPKGTKKKKVVASNDWQCTYTFVWPEKMKFESSALSKKQAAEKASAQALQWLYQSKRITKQGLPVFEREMLEELRRTLNKPLEAEISENSLQRVLRIWEDYESGGIKDIFAQTHEEALKRRVTPSIGFVKDSTVEEESDYSEEEMEHSSDINDISEPKLHPVYGRPTVRPTKDALFRRQRALDESFRVYAEQLTPLPIDDYAQQIASTLETHRVAVIVGAAGCGKSTRAPAAILRSQGVKMAAVVSEPRRVAAVGLACRVASELGEEVGETIGYQVRLQSKPPRPPGGSILYCTSGVLLRRLQANPGLEGCTHVFIDEAHCRDVNTDITLLLLKRALVLNPELRVVIMSATLDTEVFTRYFEDCPVIEVPGRTHTVEVINLEDLQQRFPNLRLPQTVEMCSREDGRPSVYCQEVVQLIKEVDKREPEGAILVFLPGWAEIKAVFTQLYRELGSTSTHLVLPVHSRLSTEDQTKMFARALPGVRKIVLATNIAETSITIPDVVYVVDTGSHKETRLKEGTGMASLETVWVSQAAAKQRAGRAGRVQPGVCYRLYTKEKEDQFSEHPTPEILRIPLEQTVLDCKTYAPEDKVESFLSQLPEPPSKKAIQIAVKDLIDLGALNASQDLTCLGRHLSSFTLHPRLACCLLHSAVIGDVISAADIVTNLTDNVDVFRQSADRRDEIREIKRKYNATSDHMALHWIQDEFETLRRDRDRDRLDRWCERHGLRQDRLMHLRALSNLHLEQLLNSGAVPSHPDTEQLNRFSDIDQLCVATLLSAADSLLVTSDRIAKGKAKQEKKLFTSAGDRAHISAESVNHGVCKKHPVKEQTLLAYAGGRHSAERRALLLYQTSIVSPHAALIFTKGGLKIEASKDAGDKSVLSLPRHRLNVLVPTSQAEAFLKAKEMLWSTFQYHYERDVRQLDPEIDTAVSRFKIRLVKALGRILVEAEKDTVGECGDHVR